MSVAYLTNATGAGVNGTGNMTLDSSGANLLIAVEGWYSYGNTHPTPTENKGNTYASTSQYDTSTPTSVQLYYSNQASPTVGSGHYFDFAYSGAYIGGVFASFSGANAGGSVLDGSQGGTTVSSSLTLPSITPTENNCLVVTAIMFEDNSGGAINVPSGYTLINSVAYSGNNEGIALAYQVQTTATATAPQWNITNSAAIAGIVAVFKGPGGGVGGGTTPPSIRLGALGVG